MKRKRIRYIQAVALSTAITIGIAGCADENPWQTVGSEKGSINLTLSADYGYETARPLVRSGEEGSPTIDLSDITGITLPKKEDFSIKLESADNTTSKIWTSLADFEEDAKKNEFAIGLYTLTASYGNKGEQGINKPYFEAETDINILAGRTRDVSMTAELKNSLVKIEYTEAFKAYMSDYKAYITSDKGAGEIEIGKDETGIVFLEPGNTTLSLNFTTNVTRKEAAKLTLGNFETLAKTLYTVTIDVTPNANGATLSVVFDENIQEGGDVEIDLTEELYSRPAPTITPTGFVNGETIDMKENGATAEIKMDIFAPDGIKSATLSVAGSSGYTYNETIDLISGNAPTGITKTNFPTGVPTLAEGEKPEKVTASLDLTNYARTLCASGSVKEYTLTLRLTDLYDKQSEDMTVVLNSEDLSMTHPEAAATAGEVAFGSKTATVNLTYNGANPENVKFFDKDGNEATIQTIAYNGETVYTRALETKVYEYTLNLPKACIGETTTLKAYDKNKYDSGQSSSLLGTFDDITVGAPEFEITAEDAYATYAYLQLSPKMPEGATEAEKKEALEFITDKVEMVAGGTIKARYTDEGQIGVNGLKAGAETTVSLKVPWSKGEKTATRTFTTETATQIPNGDFSKTTETINMTGVQVGGTWTGIAFKNPSYYSSSSIVISTPNNWASINDKTCYEKASNINTWFCVPSTYAENGKVIIRSVGYDHNGTTPSVYCETTVYYNKTAPSFGEGKQIAGELFLGEYQYDGSETRKEGIVFQSRPVSISFDYKYEPINDETASAEFIVFDASGSVIASASENLSSQSSETTKTLKFDGYSKFGSKVASIRVKFKSSTATLPSINIPTGTALKEEGVKYSSRTIDANTYHALAIGSVLTIDNVTLDYTDPWTTTTQSQAPKRKQNSKKR